MPEQTESSPATKLYFQAYRDSAFRQPDTDLKFDVQFNPTEYGLAFELVYNNKKPQNGTDAEQHFSHAKPSELKLSFTLDGTGAGGKDHENVDVSEQLNNFMDVVYKYQGDKHRPRYVLVSWGRLTFKGALKTININYSLFKPDGFPLRAKVDAVLVSALSFERQVAENSPESPDMTHLRYVHDGDNLPLMTHGIYEDPSLYVQVAKFNGLVNFRRINTGQQIIFPPIKETE
jgi:hypothetical protein